MFDIISDYNSATTLGHIGRMNSVVGYVVLNLITDSLVKCVPNIGQM
jgi:hypothetical protein